MRDIRWHGLEGTIVGRERPNEGLIARADAELAQSANETDEMADSIGKYLRAIGRHPLLNVAQEITLGSGVQKWMRLRDIREA